MADLARGDPERALEHPREVRRVAEAPAEGDLRHRAAPDTTEIVEAALQPLVPLLFHATAWVAYDDDVAAIRARAAEGFG